MLRYLGVGAAMYGLHYMQRRNHAQSAASTVRDLIGRRRMDDPLLEHVRRQALEALGRTVERSRPVDGSRPTPHIKDVEFRILDEDKRP